MVRKRLIIFILIILCSVGVVIAGRNALDRDGVERYMAERGGIAFLDLDNVFTGTNNLTKVIYASDFRYQNGSSVGGGGGELVLWARSASNLYQSNLGDFVGIGTQVPTHELTVIGDVNITGTLYVSQIQGPCLGAEVLLGNGSCASVGSGGHTNLTGDDLIRLVGNASGVNTSENIIRLIGNHTNTTDTYFKYNNISSQGGLNISADGNFSIVGCDEGEIQKYTGDVWTCSADATGGGGVFTNGSDIIVNDIFVNGTFNYHRLEGCYYDDNVDLQDNSTICDTGGKPVHSHYNNGWIFKCCALADNCFQDTDFDLQNTSSVCDKTGFNASSMSFLNSAWTASCCDNNGNCFKDNSIIPSNPSTYCDGYNQSALYTLQYTSSWELFCCDDMNT